ncbi:MAG: SAM-dependent methyltransferase [Bdellovibrionales bacterium]
MPEDALTALIRDLIATRGPLSVADYMELALQHPDYGYYRHGDPLGRAGDFITAPEISQMFGEMIGVWCAEVWRGMGAPKAFALVELGPGRGTLMRDALRATLKVKGFHDAMDLVLLESSATLREAQNRALAEHAPRHVDSLADCPPVPTIFIANEFFDALPIRQFEKGFQGWCERLVGTAKSQEFIGKDNQQGNGMPACAGMTGFRHDMPMGPDVTPAKAGVPFSYAHHKQDADSFLFMLSAPDPAYALLIPEDRRDAKPGAVYEVSFAALRIMRDLAQHLARHGGAALTLDYGAMEPAGVSTLQAISRHQRANVLGSPGSVDLTAHVDFGMLAVVSRKEGLAAHGAMAQGEFLEAMGIRLRAAQLKQRATPDQAKEIDAALLRLTDSSQMGTLFKAMAVSPQDLRDLPGFGR